jgi:hypothetical protein
MAYEKLSHCTLVAVSALLLPLAINCHGQEPAQDHSCTANVAGEFAVPLGKDGHNFVTGWGLRAGGGFAVSRPAEPSHGVDLYITANYMYEKLSATAAALAQAKAANPVQLASAVSAHGTFSAITLDPTVRLPVDHRISLYVSGGFGWFRRGVSFNGANPATLTRSSGVTLGRLAANSGAFDLGGGANFGLRRTGGLMLFAEARVYRALAVNSGTTLVPLSVGVRW